MDMTYELVDIEKFGGRQPEMAVARRVGETWVIAYAPALPPAPMDWRQSFRGDVVRVPLLPYLANADVGIAMAFAAQIGAYAAGHAPARVMRTHLAIGAPVEEVVDEESGVTKWRFWLGIALQVSTAPQ